MKLNRPQANAMILHGLMPFPLLLESSFASYLVLFWVILRTGRLRNVLLLAAAGIGAFLIVRASPVYGDLTPQMRANSINMTASTCLIMLSPLFRLNFNLSPSRYADISIMTFLIIGLALTHLADAPGALLQVGCFSIVLYMFTADTRLRQILGASAVLFSGARILLLAIVLGWTLMRGRVLGRMITLSMTAVVAYFLLSGDTFSEIRYFLEGLHDSSILMKGRTVFWLTLITNEPTLFGNGAGSALLLIEARIDDFHLPHNEYLRVFSDYGTMTLLALVIILALNAANKEAHKRLGTLLLAFYMLTGNPLSFPTVIVSYLLIMNSDVIRRGLPAANRQQAMTASCHLPHKGAPHEQYKRNH